MRAKQRLLAPSILCTLLGCQQEHGGNRPSASVAPPPPSVQSPVLSLGQTAELPSYRIRLASQRDCTGAVRTGNRSWAVELEVTNTSAKKIPVNPFYATLEDDQKYSYTTNLVGCAPLLAAKLLEPNETVRGYVPYELPRTTAHVALSYHPIMLGNASYVARFQIEL
jgi:hypothetical protein